LCNLGQALDRRVKLRAALHRGGEGQLSKTHGEPLELSMHMWLQSEIKYSLPPHLEMVLHYQQRGTGLFNGHTLHTSCCLQTLTDSTRQTEERKREKQGVCERYSRNKQMK